MGLSCRYRIVETLTFMEWIHITGLILGLHPANERRHYKVTPSLIGWAQTSVESASPRPSFFINYNTRNAQTTIVLVNSDWVFLVGCIDRVAFSIFAPCSLNHVVLHSRCHIKMETTMITKEKYVGTVGCTFWITANNGTGQIEWNLSITTTSIIRFIACDLFSNVF